MDAAQNYEPSLIQQTTNVLYGNHFRFTVDRLPDLTFFVQSMRIPSVSSTQAPQTTPFSTVYHPGDHLTYSTFEITYMIDAQFKNYFSLYYWLRGYGFPQSFEDVTQFRAQQQGRHKALLPTVADIEKTRGTLLVLTPDTGTIVAQIVLEDIFPMTISELPFATTDVEPPILTTTVTFSCSTFEVHLGS